MIYGIGVDVTGIARFEKRKRTDRFVQRTYGPAERQELEALTDLRLPERLAGAWAAKEAFLKAVGTGLYGFPLCDIQLLHEDSGRPRLVFAGEPAAWMAEHCLTAHVSLSHDGGICTAFVLLESTNEEKIDS